MTRRRRSPPPGSRSAPQPVAPLEQAFAFALGASPEAERARQLVREPRGTCSGPPPADAGDHLDRQLDALDRDVREMGRLLESIREGLAIPPIAPESLLRDRTLLADLDRHIAVRGLTLPDAPTSSGVVMGLRPLLASGTFRGDLGRVANATGDVPDSDRGAALERLARRFPTPVHGRRRSVLEEARTLHHRANREQLVRERVTSALWMLAPRLVQLPALEAPRELRRRLNAEVTEDLGGGPEWRRHTEGREVPWAALETVAAAAKVEPDPAPERLARIWDVATPAQRRLLETLLALLETDPKATVSDAARCLGWQPSTARTQLARLRAKAAAL